LILSGAASSTCCDFAADYEQLRSDVLEGASTGRHFGLVILLREGVAAWMAHASARPATITGGTPKDRSMAAPVVRDDLRADMVVVLANMVMAMPEERCA
jgi:hypothetical protein